MNSTYEELTEMCEGIARDLDAIARCELEDEDGNITTMFDYLDDLLDYEYTFGSQREYKGCSIMLTWGGPNIFVNTISRCVEGYWGQDRVSVPISHEASDRIDEFMQELIYC